jgi:hypothetical protein
VTAVEIPTSPRRSDLRWFGVVVASFFGLLGGLFWWHDAIVAARVLWGVGFGLAALYYALPPLRLPLYLGWMHAVAPIGWVVTHLVLASIFYGLITPMGAIMRLFGRDRLHRGFDASAESYWSAHDPGGDTARYFRQT